MGRTQAAAKSDARDAEWKMRKGNSDHASTHQVIEVLEGGRTEDLVLRM
jgi:hypothetical protein